MRVLVVDDSRVFRRALQNELTLGGYEVVVAGDGQEALQVLESQVFDLVTLDVDMPEMDGFETCARIRQGPRKEVRILFITSRESVEDRQRGFTLGATDFFHKKDFKAGELLATVNGMLRPNRLMEGLVAMVVDDSGVARNLAATPLREHGVRVLEAEDGDVAIGTLSKMSDIDMVLTDRHMPRMSGDDLCRHLRKQFGWKEVPIIFLTAASEQHEVIEIFKAGATDYLHKPFTKEELLARLSVHLQARQLNQKLTAFSSQLEQRVKEATHEIRAKNLLLEQRLREVTALNQVSLALCSTQAVDDVLQETSRHAQAVLDAEACTVYFLDREIGELVMAGAGDTVRVKVDPHVEVRDADSGEGILLVGAEHHHMRQMPAQQVRHRLTVPLSGGADVYGTLQVVNKKSVDPFDTQDHQLLETFAGIASVAVQNARLLDRTRRLAEDLRESLEKERWLAIEKSKMGAYIPKHVVDEISRNREQKLALGGKTVTATILFSDIQGFTRLSENMPPPRLVSFLNEYMTALTREVEAHGGIVDKFIGDAIMAIFLPTGADDNQAVRAVKAGVGMQQQILLHAPDWATRFPEVAHLQTRIGINTGEVVAGNIGSETRMDYTVIGDNVNVASRIESNGVGGQVHISESTWEAAQGCIKATRLEPIHVKNRVQPVHIYAVDLTVSESDVKGAEACSTH